MRCTGSTKPTVGLGHNKNIFHDTVKEKQYAASSITNEKQVKVLITSHIL